MGEPTKKRFVNEMIGWSAKYSDFPMGDPELHHVAGTLYAEGKDRLLRLVYKQLLKTARTRAIRCGTAPRPRHKRLARDPRSA